MLESTKISYYELIFNMFGFEIILELELHLMVQVLVQPWSIVAFHWTGTGYRITICPVVKMEITFYF